VHYAGVGCEMDAINALAADHNLLVIEDAAQGIDAHYKGKHLGTIGHLGSFSFHQTKNISSGEGGALLVNDEKYVERAEIIREKGTDRSAFYRGQVDKYTWRDVGSSFLPSDILAAFLLGQFHALEKLQENRMRVWHTYREALGDISERHEIRMPFIPEHCDHNAHMFYILIPDGDKRDVFLTSLHSQGIGAVFHYVPLHSAPKGLEIGRVHGSMQQTDDLSGRLVRLPLFSSMTMTQTEVVIDQVVKAARKFF
jgi:dTDP-4-amino-4,6-dideoxygalactose transaminase